MSTRRRWLAPAALLLVLALWIPGVALSDTISTSGACPSAISGFPLNPGSTQCWLADQRALYLWDGTVWQQILTVSPGGGITIPGLTVSLNNPTITGTVAGGATYSGITVDGTSTLAAGVAIASPTITGTVAGGASYTSPTITGTVGGGASYTGITATSPTLSGTVAGTPTISGAWVFTGAPTFQVGGATGTNKLSPLVIFNSSSNFTPATTGEETAYTFTLPASALSTDNQYLAVDWTVTTAANANTKRARLYFGATVICDTTAAAFNNSYLTGRAVVYRTGAATQKGLCNGSNTSNGLSWSTVGGGGSNLTTPAETLSGTLIVKLTLLNATAATDSTARNINMVWYPQGQ